MLRDVVHKLVAHGAGSVPGLKRLPVLKLLAIGEIALLARSHISKLDPDERRRLVHLVRTGRGGKRRLSEPEREELATLLAKAQPRQFVGLAADKLSPVPLPKRLTLGPRRNRPRD